MKKKADKAKNPPCGSCPLHWMVSQGWCQICFDKDPSEWPIINTYKKGRLSEADILRKPSKSALYESQRAILEGLEG